MSNEQRYTGDVESYPRQAQEGIPEPSRRSHTFKATLVAAGVLAALAGMVAIGYGTPLRLQSDGRRVGLFRRRSSRRGNLASYNQCFEEGATLPRGYEWDPFGNRPMPYNCDKDGWMLIERSVRTKDGSDVEQDCVREGTELPGRWHTADED